MVKEQFYVMHVMALAKNRSQILPVKNVGALVTASAMFAVVRAKLNAARMTHPSPYRVVASPGPSRRRRRVGALRIWCSGRLAVIDWLIS
jgi:hypothetical protein